MSRRLLVAVSVMVLLLLCTDRASAQFVFGVRGDVTSFSDAVHHPAGASLSFGGQMRISYLQVDLGYNRYVPASSADGGAAGMDNTGMDVDGSLFDISSLEPVMVGSPECIVHRLHIDAALMPRMYGNGRHSFNMYLGAGVTGGLELLQKPEGLAGEEDGDGSFFVGMFPVFEVEAFMTRRLAVYADVRSPYYFLTGFKEFEVHGSMGLRYLF